MNDDDERPIANLHDELRLLARVIARALGIVEAYWEAANTYPAAHPYRAALATITQYLRRRYG
jgi:hypothetical protein